MHHVYTSFSEAALIKLREHERTNERASGPPHQQFLQRLTKHLKRYEDHVCAEKTRIKNQDLSPFHGRFGHDEDGCGQQTQSQGRPRTRSFIRPT